MADGSRNDRIRAAPCSGAISSMCSRLEYQNSTESAIEPTALVKHKRRRAKEHGEVTIPSVRLPWKGAGKKVSPLELWKPQRVQRIFSPAAGNFRHHTS